MPLSKQAKALYEAALRRKGLQPGKAVRQDPREFVGPIDMRGEYYAPSRHPKYDTESKGWRTDRKTYPTIAKTYWDHTGRHQDLEDELSAAIDAGVWERRNPFGHQYYRYYNDGDIPRGITDPYLNYGHDFEDMSAYTYRYPRYMSKYPTGTRYAGEGRELTRLGQMELEARADEMVENDYKDYLRKTLSRYVNPMDFSHRVGKIDDGRLELTPEQERMLPYLEDLFYGK